MVTENQFKQILDKMTKCVNGIQRLEDGQIEIRKDIAELKTDVVELKTDVAELKTDVVELKGGQTRLENQMEIIGKSLDLLAGDNLKIKAKVQILEERVN